MTVVWCGYHSGWVPVVRVYLGRRPMVRAAHRTDPLWLGMRVACKGSHVEIGGLDQVRPWPFTNSVIGAALHINRRLT